MAETGFPLTVVTPTSTLSRPVADTRRRNVPTSPAPPRPNRKLSPTTTLRVGLIGRVTPFGQVTAPSWSPRGSMTVKSSRVNPPSTAAAAATA
jgi:hypothetical protein